MTPTPQSTIQKPKPQLQGKKSKPPPSTTQVLQQQYNNILDILSIK